MYFILLKKHLKKISIIGLINVNGLIKSPKRLLIVVSGLKIFSKCVNYWPYSCTSAQYLPVKEAHFKGML